MQRLNLEIVGKGVDDQHKHATDASSLTHKPLVFRGIPTPHLPPSRYHMVLPKDERFTRNTVVFTFRGYTNEELKEETSRKGSYWPRLSHVPYFNIDMADQFSSDIKV